MTWLSVRVRPGAGGAPGHHREAVLAALFAAGSQGVQEEGDALLTHFPETTDPGALRAAIAGADAGAAVDIAPVPDVDWSEAWKTGVRVHRVGALTIVPPWLATDPSIDPAATIVIDPGTAFGTGDHPTTRGVLRLMQHVIRAGDVVADLGAGSAILSIAAARLGASRVAAIELDSDAIGNAEENVWRNRVDSRVSVIEGDAAMLLPLIAPVRVVLANILSSVLVGILPRMAESLTADGRAILSGMLLQERETMLAALASGGWSVEREDTEDLWWSATIARR